VRANGRDVTRRRIGIDIVRIPNEDGEKAATSRMRNFLKKWSKGQAGQQERSERDGAMYVRKRV